MNSLAIVTGGSKGLGRAISDFFIKKGIFTVVISRSATTSFSSNRKNLLCLDHDLSRDQGIDSMLNDLSKYSTINELYIINNVMHSSPFETLDKVTDETLDISYTLNLKLPVKLVRFFYKTLLNASQGRVINIGSFLATEGAAESIVYSTWKHALSGFTRSLAEEFKTVKNVTCNMVSPGYLATPMLLNNPHKKTILESESLTSITRVIEIIDTLVNDNHINGKNLKIVGNFPVEIV